MTRTRLAPSPTGALHLGNARTFALTWLWARSRGAQLTLRIEDIDSPRKKLWAVDQALDDLRWLGLDWDGEATVQSTRAASHREAISQLLARGLAYPCACTRKDVEAAQSAPHAEDEVTYSGRCRDRFDSIESACEISGRPVAIRFRVQPGAITFEDAVQGKVAIDPAVRGGDFVIARWSPESGFAPGYQLAVTVDDASDGVDTVIRGADLLSSVPRQMALQRALGLATPGYVHIPLVVGTDGRRLAKRHGDTRLSTLRERGEHADRVRLWIAESSGFPVEAWSDPTVSQFTWSDLPRQPVVVDGTSWE